jgi:hypothetical protein
VWGSLGPLELQRQCLLTCFLPSWCSLFSMSWIQGRGVCETKSILIHRSANVTEP